MKIIYQETMKKKLPYKQMKKVEVGDIVKVFPWKTYLVDSPFLLFKNGEFKDYKFRTFNITESKKLGTSWFINVDTDRLFEVVKLSKKYKSITNDYYCNYSIGCDFFSLLKLVPDDDKDYVSNTPMGMVIPTILLEEVSNE